MAKVQSMLDEHNIELLDIEAEGNSDDPINVSRRAAYCWKSDSWKRPVAMVLAEFYGCQMIWHVRGNKILFSVVGRESARITWELMLPFIYKQVKQLAKEEREEDIAFVDRLTKGQWSRKEIERDSSIKGLGAYERSVGNGLYYRIGAMVAERSAEERERVGKGERALVPVDLVDAAVEEHFPNVKATATRAKLDTMGHEAAEKVSLHRQTGGKDDVKRLT